ncbi:hypothetical protein ABW21_db0208477 [Orbilia brochopaga]|nr:hypothetical protein ABW21_db0208477 [Drechslerella brochopaga]
MHADYCTSLSTQGLSLPETSPYTGIFRLKSPEYTTPIRLVFPLQQTRKTIHHITNHHTGSFSSKFMQLNKCPLAFKVLYFKIQQPPDPSRPYTRPIRLHGAPRGSTSKRKPS